MVPPHTLLGFVVIAVILGLAALGIFRVSRSDRRGPLLFKVIVIAFLVVAAAVGVVVMFYVVPAFWD